MAMSTALATSILKKLNKYCFEDVWNAIESEFRCNFSLTPVSPRYCVSTVRYGNTTIAALPDAGAYMVYHVTARPLRDKLVLGNEWVSAIDIAENVGALVTAFTSTGVVMPAGSVFFSRIPDRNLILIAVKSSAFAVTGVSSGLPLYLTMYLDENRETDLDIQEFVFPKDADQTTINQITSLTLSHPTALVLRNGCEIDPTDTSLVYKSGDVVDVIIDDDVFAVFDVPVDTGDTTYVSTLYAEDRDVLHIPNAQNPNNYLITADSVTVTIRDTQSNKGLYYPRIAQHAIEQVTHCDVSLSRTIITALRNDLPATTVYARVRVRKKPTPRLLVTDRTLLGDLYSLPDSEIVQILVGKGDSTLTQWLASYLESSEYISLIYNASSSLDPSMIQTYLTGLGYYETTAILSSNRYSVTYKPNETLVITKPDLLAGLDASLYIFANGTKIPQYLLTVTDYDTSRLRVDINPSAGITEGTVLEVFVTEGKDTTPVTFEPTPTNTTCQIGSIANPTVLLVTPSTDTTPVYSGSVPDVGFEQISPGDSTYTILTNSDGTYAFVATAGIIGQKVLILPETFMKPQAFDISDQVSAGKAIVISPTWQSDAGLVFPPVGYKEIFIYLNGYRLIPEVDYFLTPLMDKNAPSSVRGLDIAISNRQYLNTSGVTPSNVIEVIATTTPCMCMDMGYAINNVIRLETFPTFVDPKVSMPFIGGMLSYDYTDKGVYLLGNNIPNGTPFVLCSPIFTTVKDALSEYSAQADNAWMHTVDVYLNRAAPQDPSLIEYVSQYKLYSPYLAQIGYDIATGVFTPVNDPSSNTFLGQFVGYAYLKSLDPMMNMGSSMVNKRFCALSASYASLTVSNPDYYKILQRLIGYVLPAQDGKTLGVTLV